MADLIQTGKVRGVEAEKDDLILDPENVAAATADRGQVTAVRLGGAAGMMPLRVSAANYMAYRQQSPFWEADDE